nr:MAG TPA: hypothetical protein [Caudoviricetes sp.]
MKDQVTSIEQSKRLIELGVPAQKASMAWIVTGKSTYNLKIWETDAETKAILHQKFPDGYIPAFTVADIMELLPMFIERKGTFYLNITPCYEGWYAGYETEKGSELTSYREPKLVDALMTATEWLLSNGYELNLQ